MSYFNIISQSADATVVSEYFPEPSRANAYQSEAELEKEFIRLLQEQSYEYVDIHCNDDLVKNLRKQLEKVNSYTFTDDEWDRFYKGVIANPNDEIKEKTRLIQEDYIQPLRRDDGSTKNIRLIDKKNIHNNVLQVINQYVVTSGRHDNRYDVTVLVNGLPLVHIELKRRGVSIREAFNQINRYERDSFWADDGLYNFVQIFVISNGTETKYYSNTTRYQHIKDEVSRLHRAKTSNTFEFTSYWADANNKIIPDLVDFTRTFFSKHTLLNILTKYCVFTAEELLLVMRPYQIVATERILNRIEIAHNYKKYGTIAAGGYIWHTTGSGKTLTSFKAARLATELEYIDKVLFVVDRKDLDYQTMREYDRFEKGAANSNKSTAILKKQLEDPNCKIIITTIQKLSVFIDKNPKHEAFNKNTVIIFDECHRSQFGEMHEAIVKNFKKYHIFGFTGTPIFAVNSNASNNPNLKTTEQAFGDKLHTYTIVDAINDDNVLPFKVDYIKTIDLPEDIEDEDVYDIDREQVYADPRRIEQVVDYIIKHFDQKTYRNEKSYKHTQVENVSEIVSTRDRLNAREQKAVAHISGFNSIFAVSSIDVAKRYYSEFKKQMSELPDRKKLKVGLIYSYGANEEETDGILDEENSEDTTSLDQSSRDFLEGAIKDYNEMFSTNYDTSSDKFQNYYKDVSLRMKNKELDLLIVVNMFLTGFDATTLNTLWVDKNLKMHGLVQAYSRTNRILNSIKKFGNIVCFRNLQKKTDDAISLFGDKKATGIVLLKGFKDYYDGYTDGNGKHHKGYKEIVEELLGGFPLTEPRFEGEQHQKDFIALFGSLLRMKNLLSSFDDFEGNELIKERDFQDYCGRYNDLKEEWDLRRSNGELSNICDDVVFEIELLKQIEINIDYILMLVQKFHDSHSTDQEILINIRSAINASPELRSKKALIENFISGINDIDDVVTEWRSFISEKKEEELKALIESENLDETRTRKYISDSFEAGQLKIIGTDVDLLLPPMSRFGSTDRKEKKARVILKLLDFYQKFYGIY